MNRQGPGKIDWTDYTWNPVTGCWQWRAGVAEGQPRLPGSLEGVAAMLAEEMEESGA